VAASFVHLLETGDSTKIDISREVARYINSRGIWEEPAEIVQPKIPKTMKCRPPHRETPLSALRRNMNETKNNDGFICK
jgi:hypothetical protein